MAEYQRLEGLQFFKVVSSKFKKTAKTGRVTLQNGLHVKVPAGKFNVGDTMSLSEIFLQEVGYIRDYIHESLVEAPESIGSLDSITRFEVPMIQECIQIAVKKFIGILAKKYDEVYFQEVCEEVFFTLYQRGFYSQHRSSKSSFQNWINTGVYRLFIDWYRSPSFKLQNSALSLNRVVGNDSGDGLVTFQDLLEDSETIQPEDAVLQNHVVKVMMDAVEDYDLLMGDCLPGHSYSDVFKFFLKRESIQDYPVSHSNMRPLLNVNFNRMVEKLAPVFQALTA